MWPTSDLFTTNKGLHPVEIIFLPLVILVNMFSRVYFFVLRIEISENCVEKEIAGRPSQ